MRKLLFLLSLLHSSISFAQKSSLSEQLLHSTVRIQCKYELTNSDGEQEIRLGTGSGFFFVFNIVENNDTITIPVIVTNKHVVAKSVEGAFYLTLKDSHGNPLYGEKLPVVLANFQDYWISHPDNSVDLCIMPIASIIQEAKKQKKDVYFKTFSENIIPDEAMWSSFTALEEVLMIGYPHGLWDEINNLPIVRVGQTATPLKIDYQGKVEFLLNVPAFPGSSGSPIILYNQGTYASEEGISLGTRLYLLGILYGGPVYPVKGKGGITIDKVPLDFETSTEIPINIGAAIKSTKLFDFKELLKKMVKDGSK